MYVLTTHDAGYSHGNGRLFIRRIVRATAGLAQICQWSESVAPRQNGGQLGGFGGESPPLMFSEECSKTNKSAQKEQQPIQCLNANRPAWVKS